jgi:hypothetical protein
VALFYEKSWMNDTNDLMVMAYGIEESMGWMGTLDDVFYVVR